jgi:DNA-binding response OmpR family regulator
MTTPLIAVIEDEDHLAQGLVFNLEAEGYRAHHESDGDAALSYLLEATAPTAQDPPAAIVLDCMLPGADGFTIARALRDAQRFTPILMLTARARPEDILEGLEAGADDYLPKPFDLSILLARVKSLLRRSTWQSAASPTVAANAADPAQLLSSHSAAEGSASPSATYTFADRTIRFDTLELVTPTRTVNLTLMEADLLRYLTDREGQVIPRSDILEQVWHVHADTDTRAIDNFIVRLRRYLENDPANPTHLLTVRGVGYRFIPNP